jgi:hypothetical protein
MAMLSFWNFVRPGASGKATVGSSFSQAKSVVAKTATIKYLQDPHIDINEV